MSTRTVDLSSIQDGATATLRAVVPWGLVRRLARLDREDLGGYAHAVLTGLVESWNLRDPDGNALPEPSALTPDQADALDYRVVGAIMQAANQYIAGPDDTGKLDGASSAS